MPPTASPWVLRAMARDLPAKDLTPYIPEGDAYSPTDLDDDAIEDGEVRMCDKRLSLSTPDFVRCVRDYGHTGRCG